VQQLDIVDYVGQLHQYQYLFDDIDVGAGLRAGGPVVAAR
jgi:hypothetical protein